MNKKDVNMLSGPIVRGLLTITFPFMIMQILQSLINIVDMTILKSFDTDGGIAVGAVGECSALITSIVGLVSGISAGVNVVVAKNIGRRDSDGINRAISSAVCIAMIGGVILSLVGVLFAEVFLSAMGCPAEIFSQSVLYFRLYFVGVPIFLLYNFCAAILRSSGNTKGPMVYLTLGGIVKVLLTYVFVGWFRLGVAGVSFATILAYILSLGLALNALLRSKGPAKLCLKGIRFHKTETKEILQLGVPSGLQQCMYSVANVAIITAVNSFGVKATTGVSIANNFDGVLYQVCVAASHAVMPYVSQNIGNNNPQRARQAVRRGILIAVSLGAFFGSLSAIFSPQLASIMSDDPEVINYARQKMIIISSTYFIHGINEILGGALRGLGKPIPSAICTFLFMCVLRFAWVYFIFPLLPNLTFLYLVWPIGWLLCIVCQLAVYLPTIRKHIREAAAPAAN